MSAKDLKKIEKQAKEEEKIRYVSRPTVLTTDFLAEEIWDRKGQPKFIVYHFKDESTEETDKIDLEETDQQGRQVIYVPVDNEALRKGLVIVPTGLRECTFKEVLEKIDRFASLPNFDAVGQDVMVKFLSRVVVGTWFLDRFVDDPLKDVAGAGKFSPIIPIRGPSQSGKNRLAFLLRMLSYRPYFEMSTYRVPSLYRPMDLWKGTLILDEADFAQTTEKSELIHYLNCRATGTPISRQDPKNPKVTHTFLNFGVTILTQRRIFDDNATESRSLPYFSESTNRKLPSVETDVMLRDGLEIQEMMLYLRFKYYSRVKIEKDVWINEVTDPRLMAALLPLLALSEHEPSLKNEIKTVVKELEILKIEQKSNSEDGTVVNLIWEKVSEGKFAVWNNPHYYVMTKAEDEVTPIPLTTSKIADDLKWSTRTVRKVINSLGMCGKGLPSRITVGNKSWRVIFFEPTKLDRRLKEFVVDYEPKKLFNLIEGKGFQTVLDEKMTQVTQVTDTTHGDIPSKENASRAGSVTSVTSVTQQSQEICFLCDQPLPKDQKYVTYFNQKKVHNHCAKVAYRED